MELRKIETNNIQLTLHIEGNLDAEAAVMCNLISMK
ncbi:hypothetical protein VIAE109791_08875 [Vibrio aestuarianus subsp. francensis]